MISAMVNGSAFATRPYPVTIYEVPVPPGPPDPALSTLIASPDTVLANGTDVSTITLTLKDKDGRPIPGVNVIFSIGIVRSTITPTDKGDGTYVYGVTSDVAGSTEVSVDFISINDIYIEPVTVVFKEVQ